MDNLHDVALFTSFEPGYLSLALIGIFAFTFFIHISFKYMSLTVPVFLFCLYALFIVEQDVRSYVTESYTLAKTHQAFANMYDFELDDTAKSVIDLVENSSGSNTDNINAARNYYSLADSDVLMTLSQTVLARVNHTNCFPDDFKTKVTVYPVVKQHYLKDLALALEKKPELSPFCAAMTSTLLSGA